MNKSVLIDIFESPIVQVLAKKLDFFKVCDIKWGYFEWELHILKVLLCCFLSYVNKDMA